MDEFELYLSGMSIPEVSKEIGIPQSTLRFRFKNKGILRSRGEAIRLAAKKGKLGSGLRGKKRIFTEEWKENIRQGKLKHGLKYAIGLSKKSNGYIEITRGANKGKGQHVVIMERFIGRQLEVDECVHHMNEIRDDNRLCNLQLMTRSEHMKLHANKRTIIRDKKGRITNGKS
ncbi:HNH endonuclease [Candidatus Pacearchaeota archaeon]|nr:HNH endonuclease [Candidatus Pacearchaeota archaeon]